MANEPQYLTDQLIDHLLALFDKRPERDKVITATTQILQAYPGVGKSRTASSIGNSFHQSGGSVLHLMLSHSAIRERLSRLEDDGFREAWGYWQGHQEGCARGKWALQGFETTDYCDCGRPALTQADRPTLAPLDYIFEDPPEMAARVPQVRDFQLWIIDEFDTRRTLGNMQVSTRDLRLGAQTHPAPEVKVLCRVIGELLDRLKIGERLEGSSLYFEIDMLLKQQGNSWESLLAKLPPANNLPLTNWGPITSVNPMPNFPPKLVHLLREQFRASDGGANAYNPCVHLGIYDGEPQLRLWWRKHLPLTEAVEPDGHYWDTHHPPALIFDAAANEQLVRKVFSWVSIHNVEKPWPLHAHVYQWADDLVTRGTMGMSGAGRPGSFATRTRWYDRIKTALNSHGIDKDDPIGVITHSAIENEITRHLNGEGFLDVTTLHYFGQRGTNELENHRVLVLLGCPIPNPVDFREEAQAFFAYDDLLNFDTWEDQTEYLDMVDGTKFPVVVKTYRGDANLEAYYDQKCMFGLYQAIHRLRPLIRDDDEMHIFVFTDMPIPGVKVQEVLGPTATRFHLAVTTLISYNELSVPRLAKELIERSFSESAARRWVQREAEEIAKRAGYEFIPGIRGRSGKFVKGTPIDLGPS